MNHYRAEKNNMYQKMFLFFANPVNIAVWAAFTRLVDEIANFVSLKASLSTYIQQHHADISGFTASKNKAFDTMIKLVVKKSKKAYVWAVDTASDKLAHVFDV